MFPTRRICENLQFLTNCTRLPPGEYILLIHDCSIEKLEAIVEIIINGDKFLTKQRSRNKIYLAFQNKSILEEKKIRELLASNRAVVRKTIETCLRCLEDEALLCVFDYANTQSYLR